MLPLSFYFTKTILKQNIRDDPLTLDHKRNSFITLCFSLNHKYVKTIKAALVHAWYLKIFMERLGHVA